MAKAGDSIKEKMKAIKDQQEKEAEAGETFTHNPNEFKFVNKKILKGEVHNHEYFFNQRSIENHGLIYKTNRAVYATADKMDTVVSGFSVFAGYKAFAGVYALAMGQSASMLATGGWGLLCYF